MTQDVYLGRRVVNAGNLAVLESYGPRRAGGWLNDVTWRPAQVRQEGQNIS
jgi:hypothetical protein